MKTTLTAIALAWMSTNALAQSASKETLRLTVGGQTLIIPVEFDAGPGDAADSLRLSATTNLATVLPIASAALWTQMQNLPQTCEDRLSVNDTQISAGSGVLTATIDLTYEQWVCGRVLGQDTENAILRETVAIQGAFAPFVEDGKLQIRLDEFSIENLGVLARIVNVEEMLRADLEQAVTALNADASFSTLPAALADEGYRWESVSVQAAQGGELSVAVVGPDSALALFRALDGLTGN